MAMQFGVNQGLTILKNPHEIFSVSTVVIYASVECVERGLNPLKTKLVVMSYPSDDPSQRGSGLILASSPAAKKPMEFLMSVDHEIFLFRIRKTS